MGSEKGNDACPSQIGKNNPKRKMKTMTQAKLRGGLTRAINRENGII
jgi:hypothetical protein